MGYDVSANGLINIPASFNTKVLEDLDHWGEPVEFTGNIPEYISECLALDASEPTIDADGNQSLSFYWGGRGIEHVEGGLYTLATGGATGYMECRGEDDDSWKIVLRDGTTQQLNAQVYYPGDTEPGADVVALNNTEVIALLALVAGDSSDAISALVEKVSKAL